MMPIKGVRHPGSCIGAVKGCRSEWKTDYVVVGLTTLPKILADHASV